MLYPTIENHEKLAEKAFYTEEKRRKLTCSGRGEPQPKYQWLFRKSGGVNTEFQNALNVFPELKISQGSNGESYLEFPVVRNSHRGEYKCIAENSEGQVEKKYVVKVSGSVHHYSILQNYIPYNFIKKYLTHHSSSEPTFR